MELNAFIENMRSLFEETDPLLISEDTYFQELDEWSSLTTLSVIAMVRTVYNRNITGQQIRQCDTIEELFETTKGIEVLNN